MEAGISRGYVGLSGIWSVRISRVDMGMERDIADRGLVESSGRLPDFLRQIYESVKDPIREPNVVDKSPSEPCVRN
ncbi:hypothetical protein E2C01_070580 [Portunus trituberculatus]|uniref:Uncharacterized protein n=1 Tax=Portunus trituberculatus TaxID=210409 RepID=A0A5B7I1P5_PORTR|nr:hypothetical protein [Portunus trituberculatus]